MAFEPVYRKLGVVIIEHALDTIVDLAEMEAAFPVSQRPRALRGPPGVKSDELPALSPALADWLETHPELIDLASGLIAAPAHLVEITARDEAEPSNWLLPWRQARTIAVASRHRLKGWKGWSERKGYWRVEPPSWVLEQSVILRVYLDDCRAIDGPVEVATRTHGMGHLKRTELTEAVANARSFTCLCDRGDILALSPLAVHRRHRAVSSRRVRVIDLMYSSARLPVPLEWASLTPGLEIELIETPDSYLWQNQGRL